MNDLISIIVPIYNSELYLEDTILSVTNQTYSNFELLLINDCSTDNSKSIYKKYRSDKRIKWFDLETNNGPAIARNKGIKEAKGKYICFLDSDDFWDRNKLLKQYNFMKENDIAFSFTGYEFVNEKGIFTGKSVSVPNRINYKQTLKNTTIWTSTVMLNMNYLTKEDIYMPNVKRGQDTATWWKILKKIDYAYGFDEVLSYYRRTNNSLSSNKIIAVKRTWNLYRNVEHFNIIKSLYYFNFYLFNSIKKRL